MANQPLNHKRETAMPHDIRIQMGQEYCLREDLNKPASERRTVRILSIGAVGGLPVVAAIDSDVPNVTLYSRFGKTTTSVDDRWDDLVPIPERPSLRKWSMEDVPAVCWLRRRGEPENVMLATHCTSLGVCEVTWDDLFYQFEWSESPNANTWKPCGSKPAAFQSTAFSSRHPHPE